MNHLEYFTLASSARTRWRIAIGDQDWTAARFLAGILAKDYFHTMFGEESRLLLATDGDALAGFCTYARQDEIHAPTLFPWIGFVFTAPEYRGLKLAGQLIEHACAIARSEEHERIYISTDHVGLYEKYGFTYLRDMPDPSGAPCRVYARDL